MQKNPYRFAEWKRLIPDIDAVISQMEQTPILSVGITPYTRIIPSFFLKNYSIFTVKRSSDVDVMEQLFPMHVLEDRYPDVAKRVHGTGYLIGNFAFQAFLKSRRITPTLVFNTISEKTIEELEQWKIPWIGNAPETLSSVMLKGPFRELLRKLDLPSLPSKTVSREEFLASPFESLWQEFEGAFVVQRADKEVGGNDGTFFIHTSADFERCTSLLSADTRFESVLVSAFVDGYSTSALGCVMKEGILAGPVQLQLIDVSESLNGGHPAGCFFGNDMGFHPWGEHIEKTAEDVVKGIGEHLKGQGYRGIFGIDFLYDKKRDKIFPNECNPRSPGSTTLYSLMLLELGLPPLEFFHLMAQLDIASSFNFEEVNKTMKTRLPCSHIAFSPKGITSMELPLLAGIYEYDPKIPSLDYKRPGISLADIQNEREFLIIDTVPSLHDSIEQNVPRLFKFIFKRSIAKSSYEIDAEAAFLVRRFAAILLEAVEKKKSAPQA